MWTQTEITAPVVRHEIRTDAAWLTVDAPNYEGKIWQYLNINAGAWTTRSTEDCLANWPREAIARIRQALDELEARV